MKPQSCISLRFSACVLVAIVFLTCLMPGARGQKRSHASPDLKKAQALNHKFQGLYDAGDYSAAQAKSN